MFNNSNSSNVLWMENIVRAVVFGRSFIVRMPSVQCYGVMVMSFHQRFRFSWIVIKCLLRIKHQVWCWIVMEIRIYSVIFPLNRTNVQSTQFFFFCLSILLRVVVVEINKRIIAHGIRMLGFAWREFWVAACII